MSFFSVNCTRYVTYLFVYLREHLLWVIFNRIFYLTLLCVALFGGIDLFFSVPVTILNGYMDLVKSLYHCSVVVCIYSKCELVLVTPQRIAS